MALSQRSRGVVHVHARWRARGGGGGVLVSGRTAVAGKVFEKNVRERRRVVVRAFENREEGKEEGGEGEDVGRSGTGGQRDGDAAEEQTTTMDYRAFRARLVASERAEVASDDTEATSATESERWMYEVRDVPTSYT